MAFNGFAFENPVTPKGSSNLCYANSGRTCYKNEFCKNCQYLSVSHFFFLFGNKVITNLSKLE